MNVVTHKWKPVRIALSSVKIYAVTDDWVVFDSVLSYKVEVQIKRYKAIVKYSESQTI